MNTTIKYAVNITCNNKPGVKYILTHNKNMQPAYTEHFMTVDDYVISDYHVDAYYKKYFMNQDIENNIINYDLKVNESGSHVLELCDEYFATINVKRIA